MAILIALFTSPRFPKTALFPFAVAAFVCSTAAVLLVARRRWQRLASELQHEIDLLEVTP